MLPVAAYASAAAGAAAHVCCYRCCSVAQIIYINSNKYKLRKGCWKGIGIFIDVIPVFAAAVAAAIAVAAL